MPSRKLLSSILSIALITFSPLGLAKKAPPSDGDQAETSKADAGADGESTDKAAGEKKPAKKHSKKKAAKANAESDKAPAPAEPSSGGGW